MLFIPILILGIVLYMCGQRVLSLLIFFFFLFQGFQIFPEEWFETGVGFSKSLDFAFLYVLFLFIWGCCFYKNFIPLNKLTYLIIGYLSFILILILISKFVYGIGWGDIIRTSRFFFLVLSYYIIRRCTREEIETVLKICLIILFFQCLLFIMQAFTGKALLAGAEDNLKPSGNIIKRFYNMPKMIFFLLFYVLFVRPFPKWINILIGSVALVGILIPMHRSMSLVVILLIAFGIVLSMKNIKQFIKYLPYISIVVIPLAVIAVAQVSSRTLNDLQSVKNGDFLDVEDVELDSESTFLFRIAHFYERYQFAQTIPTYKYLGMGLMTEDSPYTAKNFDFIIGLENDLTGNVTQLDTADISWSLFVVRYGIIGTLLYLIIFSILAYHYWKNRKYSYSLAVFLYMLLVIGCSLTSDMLYNVSMLIFPFLFYDFTLNEKIEE